MYDCTIRPTLTYGCGTWQIRAEDLHRLHVFDYRCLRSIRHICWKNKINNEVRRKIFRTTDKARRLDKIIQRARPRWLGLVLRMNEKRLMQVMSTTRWSSWEKSRGQQLTWWSSMHKTTKKLAVVGTDHLLGWGPRGSSSMAYNFARRGSN